VRGEAGAPSLGDASGAIGADGGESMGADAAPGLDAAGVPDVATAQDGSNRMLDSGLQDGSPGSTEASVGDASAGRTGTISVTDPSQWALTGMAQFGTGELDLTPATRLTAGAAYLPQAYAIGPTSSFEVAFWFRLVNTAGQPGDGFAFLWQNDPRGTAALGGNGGALGYSGIVPSVDVEFDIQQGSYDPVPNEVAITTNGQYMTYLAYGSPSFSMYDGATHYVWIAYQEATRTLSVFLANTATQPATPLVTTTVDLYATVGSTAYLGFTGSCGVATETNAIESLSIQYTP
jgi:hypothetical protein